ncbi:radical SAM protein [candidate division WOR-3 bacterium]|nr:radical SAM protein [candidate division WOR-3 bacterium]
MTTRTLDHSATSFVYGPVPSRRLGLSLGINVIPFKTCTLDCVYCQCGGTTRKTLGRRSFFPANDIIAAVRTAVRQWSTAKRHSSISYLTFAGEGEPTLNRDLGRIIRRLKQEFSIPVAVITNSTLLTDPQVRRDLYAADLVVPSLDAADQRTFARVNRCHRDLRVRDIIEGLKLFRLRYRGKLWLETMLVRGINDSVEQVVALRRAAWEIKPDRVQLNTVVRPPAEKSAKPMSQDDLEQIQYLFGPNTDIIGEAKDDGRRTKGTMETRPDEAIVATVQGRPVTKLDLVNSLGFPPRQIEAALRRLLRSRRIRLVQFQGKSFYEPA